MRLFFLFVFSHHQNCKCVSKHTFYQNASYLILDMIFKILLKSLNVIIMKRIVWKHMI
jgi:hypothetical protein